MAGSGRGGVAAGAAIAPGTSVAWVDFHQRLYLGDVVTGTQHVLARIKAFPGERLAQAGRRIYWWTTAEPTSRHCITRGR
jgi:hypothetical protein